jgi:hypothetical protein
VSILSDSLGDVLVHILGHLSIAIPSSLGAGEF